MCKNEYEFWADDSEGINISYSQYSQLLVCSTSFLSESSDCHKSMKISIFWDLTLCTVVIK